MKKGLLLFLQLQRVVCFPLVCSIGWVNPSSSHSAITLPETASFFLFPSPSNPNPPHATFPASLQPLLFLSIPVGSPFSLLYSPTPPLSLFIFSLPCSLFVCLIYNSKKLVLVKSNYCHGRKTSNINRLGWQPLKRDNNQCFDNSISISSTDKIIDNILENVGFTKYNNLKYI